MEILVECCGWNNIPDNGITPREYLFQAIPYKCKKLKIRSGLYPRRFNFKGDILWKCLHYLYLCENGYKEEKKRKPSKGKCHFQRSAFIGRRRKSKAEEEKESKDKLIF
jgi:hypothetical protein